MRSRSLVRASHRPLPSSCRRGGDEEDREQASREFRFPIFDEDEADREPADRTSKRKGHHRTLAKKLRRTPCQPETEETEEHLAQRECAVHPVMKARFNPRRPFPTLLNGNHAADVVQEHAKCQ